MIYMFTINVFKCQCKPKWSHHCHLLLYASLHWQWIVLLSHVIRGRVTWFRIQRMSCASGNSSEMIQFCQFVQFSECLSICRDIQSIRISTQKTRKLQFSNHCLLQAMLNQSFSKNLCSISFPIKKDFKDSFHINNV